ncbi:hypothetical protein FQN54_004328 [Arachnomyces sp. PD_36]|nr:hypothetical protein FQN54_004328 [Arachnomyces sp. PD_36]
MKTSIITSLGLLALCEASIHAGFQEERSDKRAFNPWASSNSTTCTEPQPNTCTFYPDCLEAKQNCGDEGYPIGYGLHYCELFTDAASEMTSDGQEWITDTMLCLQNALVPYGLGGSESTTCDDLKSYAFDTHPDCYVNSGVCTLPPPDWVVIVNTVSLPELFGSVDALKATLQTMGDCAEFYAWLITQGVLYIVDEAGEIIEDVGEAIGDAGEEVWDWATGWM